MYRVLGESERDYVLLKIALHKVPIGECLSMYFKGICNIHWQAVLNMQGGEL